MSLKVGRGFSLPDSYITKTAAILAKRRIGKTYNASVIAEEFVANSLPFAALDPTSAWWGLRASADGLKDGLPVTIIGGEHGDLPLDVGSGKIIADLVVEEPGFYVIDLGHWESDSEHRRWAAPFLDRLYRRKAKARDPLHLFVDEADVFAPQRPQKGDEQMLHNMEAIVRRGGIRGLGTTLITQRAGVLNKNVLTQLDLLIILRTIAPQDQDAVDDYIKRGAAGDRQEIMASLASLAPGEAWVYGPGEDPPMVQRVQFRQRRTFNSSATPDGTQRVEPKQMAPVDLEKLRARLAESIERAEAEDPRVLRRRIAALERELASRPTEVERVEVEVIREVPALTDADRTALAELVDANTRAISAARDILDGGAHVEMVLARALADESPAAAIPLKPPRLTASPPLPRAPRVVSGQPDLSLPKAQRAILSVLAQFPDGRTKTQLAMQTGYSSKGGGFNNALSALRNADPALMVGSDPMRITDAGMDAIGDAVDPLPTGAALLDHWLRQLGKAEQLCLTVLADVSPGSLSKDELAERTGYAATGGGFNNALSRLRTLLLIEGRGELRLSDELAEAIR